MEGVRRPTMVGPEACASVLHLAPTEAREQKVEPAPEVDEAADARADHAVAGALCTWATRKDQLHVGFEIGATQLAPQPGKRVAGRGHRAEPQLHDGIDGQVVRD
jgi:hypothetical protein